jgi:uncharacterized protein YaaR (DUF327 family)
MTGPLDRIQRRRKAAVDPLRPVAHEVPDEAEKTESVGFRAVLQGIAGSPSEKKLGRLMEEIHELAVVLSRRRLLEDLENFRFKVGDFLRTYLDEVLVVREAAGSARGLRRRQMVVVKKVNVELEELSKLVLSGESDFRILKELEAIEGLLMDLYR